MSPSGRRRRRSSRLRNNNNNNSNTGTRDCYVRLVIMSQDEIQAAVGAVSVGGEEDDNDKVSLDKCLHNVLFSSVTEVERENEFLGNLVIDPFPGESRFGDYVLLSSSSLHEQQISRVFWLLIELNAPS